MWKHAQFMTAQLLSNVQNIIAIGLTELGSEQYEISIELNACGKSSA